MNRWMTFVFGALLCLNFQIAEGAAGEEELKVGEPGKAVESVAAKEPEKVVDLVAMKTPDYEETHDSVTAGADLDKTVFPKGTTVTNHGTIVITGGGHSNVEQAVPPKKMPLAENGDAKQVEVKESLALNQSLAEVSAHTESSESGSSITLTPSVGTAVYINGWDRIINNRYGLGISLSLPLSRWISIEAELGYGQYVISYDSLQDIQGGYQGQMVVSHTFDQFLTGATGKAYLSQGTLRPYLGVGIVGVHYLGMVKRLQNNTLAAFDKSIGSGELLAGVDVRLSDRWSLGVRGAYYVPLFDVPTSKHNGVTSAPGWEEVNAINTPFARMLGTLSMSL